MGFPAHVLTVMIASPADTLEARNAVRDALWSWNDANARHRGVVLLPWRWETSAVPLQGRAPQALINAQGLERADIVFALFGSRLGSPTQEAVSGTVEEIEGATARKVPVHLYFSSEALPHDVELAQVEGLRAFKAEVRERGLYGEYGSTDDLAVKVWQSVEHDLADMKLGFAMQEVGTSVADISWLVQPGEEHYIRHILGKPHNATRHWLDVTNRSSSKDAQEVVFSMNEEAAAVRYNGAQGSTTIHAGQTRRLPITYFLNERTEAPKLTIRWTEGGEEKTRDFHV